LLVAAIPALNAAEHGIRIETDFGVILLRLYNNTPLNSNNMIARANDHFFDSLLFHRCIPKFVIQGGDPDSKHAKPGQLLGDGDLPFLVKAEINDINFHKRGALGVARDTTPDKSGSAAQFYIVVGKRYTQKELDSVSRKTGRKFTEHQKKIYIRNGGTPKLDGNYTVFGEVVHGMDVVDKISKQDRDKNDRPKTDIRIHSVRVVPLHWWQHLALRDKLWDPIFN
jgi:cyclophilin family peptidyl-prolyl cis-trans isomerase